MGWLECTQDSNKRESEKLFSATCLTTQYMTWHVSFSTEICPTVSSFILYNMMRRTRRSFLETPSKEKGKKGRRERDRKVLRRLNWITIIAQFAEWKTNLPQFYLYTYSSFSSAGGYIYKVWTFSNLSVCNFMYLIWTRQPLSCSCWRHNFKLSNKII